MPLSRRLEEERRKRDEARMAARYAQFFPPGESVEELQARMRQVHHDIQTLHINMPAGRVPAAAHWG